MGIMLQLQLNNFRCLIDLSGIWKFKADPEVKGEILDWNPFIRVDPYIAVPGSWNEQLSGK